MTSRAPCGWGMVSENTFPVSCNRPEARFNSARFHRQNLQEIDGADDLNAPELFQYKKIIVSADNVLSLCLSCAFENHVVFRIA